MISPFPKYPLNFFRGFDVDSLPDLFAEIVPVKEQSLIITDSLKFVLIQSGILKLTNLELKHASNSGVYTSEGFTRLYQYNGVLHYTPKFIFLRSLCNNENFRQYKHRVVKYLFSLHRKYEPDDLEHHQAYFILNPPNAL